MNKTNTPFRYDYVGSFLRPAALKQARADFQSGRINAAALKAVEDDAIRDLVAKQKAAGYHVITDGEFRRATWHLDFMWGFHAQFSFSFAILLPDPVYFHSYRETTYNLVSALSYYRSFVFVKRDFMELIKTSAV